ncbi:MAG: hypothetical protein RJA22_1789 [Verrucomicrobiota bacterium]|jgi:peptidoglycan/LPS O-acetylase OafA/YrhL
MSQPAPILTVSPGAASSFLPRLESLRGLAAMTVALAHSFRAFPGGANESGLALAADRVFNGNAAVTLFFVLSGYVLGLGLLHAGAFQWSTWRAFAVRRLFRIYPVLLLSTAVIALCLWGSASWGWPLPAWFGAADGYRSTMLHPASPPGLGTILGNVLLWTPTMNQVTWTLGIELRCSLLLPLLHAGSLRLSPRGRLLLLLSLVALAGIPKWCLLAGALPAEAAASLVHNAFSGYLFLFYLGYLIRDQVDAFRNLAARRPLAASALPWLSLLVLLGADALGDDLRILQGLGAAALIGGLVAVPAQRLLPGLDGSVARFYGRISYSFYVWHDLVLIVLARVVAHVLPGATLSAWSLALGMATLLASVALTTGLASLSFRWVEVPFQRWSKRLTARPLPVPAQDTVPGLPAPPPARAA